MERAALKIWYLGVEQIRAEMWQERQDEGCQKRSEEQEGGVLLNWQEGSERNHCFFPSPQTHPWSFHGA